MIRIITDSTCDINRSQMESLGIDILPLSVFFGEKEYRDGVDLQIDEFYEKLAKSSKLPTTSQVNPGAFHDVFKSYLDQGDSIIAILISSKISGTYQSAIIASEMLGSDNLFVIDSKAATMGLAVLVFEAIKLRDAGKGAKEIYEALIPLTDKVVFYAAVGSLKYLKMGGRISAAAAVVGGALGITPIASMVNGEVLAAGKVRGKAQIKEFFNKEFEKFKPDSNYPVRFAHTHLPEQVDELIEAFGKHCDPMDHTIGTLGCVIGTYGGPDCYGLAYIKK